MTVKLRFLERYESSATTKRAIDICISAIILVITAPIILIIATLILIVMGRPIFFIQKRPGLNEIPFKLIKFRTMSNSIGSALDTSPDNNRVTRLGHFLRSTSLDEFPSFYNVLAGDMSLVGPRPLLMEYLALYNEEQRIRHRVKPGITGWAQINGRNLQSWNERFTYDNWYVYNQSIKLDLKILIQTLWIVLRREGITETKQSTKSKFTGNQ